MRLIIFGTLPGVQSSWDTASTQVTSGELRRFLRRVAIREDPCILWVLIAIVTSMVGVVVYSVCFSGNVVDVHAWSEEDVQHWFVTYTRARWQPFASLFADQNGQQLVSATEEEFRKQLASESTAFYNVWRACLAELVRKDEVRSSSANDV